MRELTTCTDNTELLRTARSKAGSMRYNFQSIQGSRKESTKHSAELADKNEILKYTMMVDTGQERPRACHAVSITR